MENDLWAIVFFISILTFYPDAITSKKKINSSFHDTYIHKVENNIYFLSFFSIFKNKKDLNKTSLLNASQIFCLP